MSGRDRATVVPCRAEHLPAIRAIYNDAILTTTALWEYAPRSEETVRAWWEAKQAGGLPVLGVEDGGDLIGFATWGPFRPFPAYKYSVEHSVYVAAGKRRRGVGRSLLEAIVAEGATRGIHLLVGGICSSNEPSIALHRDLGFGHSGTIHQAGFKFGRWLDLEFWTLRLAGPAAPRDG
jgi:phosphinothricin acetyltransferase